MKNLKEIVAKNTEEKDGVAATNWEAVESAVNEHINAVVLKNSQKEAEKVSKEIFESLGYDGVTDRESLKNHIEKVSKGTEEIQKSLEEKEKQLAEYEEKTQTYTKQLTESEREKSLLSIGVTDPDAREFLLFNVSKRVDENTTWEDALQAYQEEKPQFFKPTIGTTGAKVSQAPANDKPGFQKILEEKYPDVYKTNTKE